MTASKAKTLHDKLVEVALAIRNIEKGGRNSAQNYSFVQEADVVRTVWPELLERGVLFYPAMRRVHSIGNYKTAKGAESFLTTVESMWIATDGVDKIEVASLGQGTDTGGDKGIYKALTGDKKYAVLQLLGIATGDDPEVARKDEREDNAPDRPVSFGFGMPAEEPKPEPKPVEVTDEMASVIDDAKAAGLDPEADNGAALGVFIYETTSKKSLKELTSEDFTKIREGLQEMRALTEAMS